MPTSPPLHVTLLGLGTVGSGVASRLLADADRLADQAGGPLRLTAVGVRDPLKARDVQVGLPLLDAATAAAGRTDILVEVMGGIEPARTLLLQALRRGVHVVTANKALLGLHGAELRAAAQEGGAGLHVEAAVAGGIPVVKVLAEALTGNRVEAVLGILNGTTNYILTRMTRAGLDFAAALAEAQALGYAEADPAADVQGHDAASKLAILAGLAFGADIPAAAVHCEGIDTVTAADIRAAAELGRVIKLLAVAKAHPNADGPAAIELRVHPAMVPAEHPLAAVGDAYNAVFIQGDAVGDLMLYGRGAGRLPTASAVLADLVDAAQDIRRGGTGRLPARVQPFTLRGVAETESAFYFCLLVADQPGVLGAVAAVLGRHGVSVASMIQKGRAVEPVDLVFVTHRTVEHRLRAALAELDRLPQVFKIAQVIRVEG